MAESTQTKSPAYRRSWKNLLINKRYQLRFTLFMVGLSAALMVLLGAWVKRVTDNTTDVGFTQILGKQCPPAPGAKGAAADAAKPAKAAAPGNPAPVDASATPPAAPPPVDPAATPVASLPAEPAAPLADAAGSASTEGDDDLPHGKVTVEETSITVVPTPPKPVASPEQLAAQQKAHDDCEKRQAGLIEDLRQRRRNIGWVLLGSGFLLCLGLAIYGIKMTHRVAGPLHKVGTYFSKMREGRYGPVYPLRKGDELLEFYEHFKSAHAGVVAAERSDVTRMRAVVEASGSGPHDPQLAKALADLQVAIERKEKALE